MGSADYVNDAASVDRDKLVRVWKCTTTDGTVPFIASGI
jgi:hypothetical protein